MRKLLTIGELAKFLDTSTFNIRYYEKEGLIEPAEVNEKGYRLYDYEQMLKYNIIMLLRDSNIPIKDIRSLITDFTLDAYDNALDKSFESLEEEIKRLQDIQKEVLERKEAIQHLTENIRRFEIKKLSKRTLYHINERSVEEILPVKELYDLFQSKGVDFTNIHKKDDYYILSEHITIHAFIDSKIRDDLDHTDFTEADYLTYQFTVTSPDDYEVRYNELVDYLYEHNLNVSDKLLLKINPITMVDENLFIGEYQIQILTP